MWAMWWGQSKGGQLMPLCASVLVMWAATLLMQLNHTPHTHNIQTFSYSDNSGKRLNANGTVWPMRAPVENVNKRFFTLICGLSLALVEISSSTSARRSTRNFTPPSTLLMWLSNCLYRGVKLYRSLSSTCKMVAKSRSWVSNSFAASSETPLWSTPKSWDSLVRTPSLSSLFRLL